MKRRRVFLVLVMGFVFASSAAAQEPLVNPRGVRFTSEDHLKALRYEFGYYLPGAAEPAHVLTVPLVTVSQPEPGTYEVIPGRPIFGANLTLKARIVVADVAGGEVFSLWSNATVPFDLRPFPLVVVLVPK
jgi:hypothetical protein